MTRSATPSPLTSPASGMSPGQSAETERHRRDAVLGGADEPLAAAIDHEVVAAVAVEIGKERDVARDAAEHRGEVRDAVTVPVGVPHTVAVEDEIVGPTRVDPTHEGLVGRHAEIDVLIRVVVEVDVDEEAGGRRPPDCNRHICRRWAARVDDGELWPQRSVGRVLARDEVLGIGARTDLRQDPPIVDANAACPLPHARESRRS